MIKFYFCRKYQIHFISIKTFGKKFDEILLFIGNIEKVLFLQKISRNLYFNIFDEEIQAKGWTDGRTNIAKTFVTCNSLHIPNHILFSSPSTHVHLLILIIYGKRKHRSGKQIPRIYNKQMWTSLSESIATLSQIHKHSHSHSHGMFSTTSHHSYAPMHKHFLSVRISF